MEPRALRNSRAILAGVGFVLSRYPLPDAPTPGRQVWIRTIIYGGPRNLTVMVVRPGDYPE